MIPLRSLAIYLAVIFLTASSFDNRHNKRLNEWGVVSNTPGIGYNNLFTEFEVVDLDLAFEDYACMVQGNINCMVAFPESQDLGPLPYDPSDDIRIYIGCEPGLPERQIYRIRTTMLNSEVVILEGANKRFEYELSY